MSTTKNGLALAKRLLRSNPKLTDANRERVRDLCSRLCRQAATLQRFAETACGRELSRTEEERDKACEARSRELVKELCAVGVENVAHVDFSGDPRGAVVKLKVTDRSGDWFGGDDYLCVLG